MDGAPPRTMTAEGPTGRYLVPLVYPDSEGVWVYRAQGWRGGGREIETIPRIRRSLGILPFPAGRAIPAKRQDLAHAFAPLTVIPWLPCKWKLEVGKTAEIRHFLPRGVRARRPPVNSGARLSPARVQRRRSGHTHDRHAPEHGGRPDCRSNGVYRRASAIQRDLATTGRRTLQSSCAGSSRGSVAAPR